MKALVLSPHLDDAILSIGCSLHALHRRGAEIEILTIFAGDEHATGTLSYWDVKSGVSTRAEAMTRRRQEDAAACAVIGATPTWLPFDDSGYPSSRDADRIWARIEPLVSAASVIFLPGWPLTHSDHRWVSMLVLERAPATAPITLYMEQPYASQPSAIARRLLGRRSAGALRPYLAETDLGWRRVTLGRADRQARNEALKAYVSQLQALGYRARVMMGLESLTGERLAPLRLAPAQLEPLLR